MTTTVDLWCYTGKPPIGESVLAVIETLNVLTTTRSRLIFYVDRDGYWTCCASGDALASNERVVAWMPLPEWPEWDGEEIGSMQVRFASPQTCRTVD